MFEWMIEIQDNLMKKYNTRDPYLLCDYLGIAVFYEDLGNMFGFFNSTKRIKMIHINMHLSDQEQKFTCAHELQHAIFHANINTPFLNEHTLLSVNKIEMQANFLATRLLVEDKKIYERKIDVLNYYGIPLEMERFYDFL